mgnify:FL=1
MGEINIEEIEARAARIYPEDSGWNGTEAEDALPVVTEDVPALVAEVRRLRAIVEGRTTPPTPAEIDAHAARRGSWVVTETNGAEWGTAHAYHVRSLRDFIGAGGVWLPMLRGRPCAWPVVEAPRG